MLFSKYKFCCSFIKSWAFFLCFNGLFRYIWILFIKHTTLSTVVFWLAWYYFLLLFDKPQKSPRRTGNELETNWKRTGNEPLTNEGRMIWYRFMNEVRSFPFDISIQYVQIIPKAYYFLKWILGTTLKDQRHWNLNGLLQITETPEHQKSVI
jgi:hypothetical protein